MKQKLLIGAVTIIIILGLFFMFRSREPELVAPVEPEGIGAEIYGEVESSGPGDIPAANPLPNPISDSYKNPFE